MKTVLVLGAASIACLVSAIAATPPHVPEQSLSFMSGKTWRRASSQEKLALAADFMRVFCVRPTMAPLLLADCLDSQKRRDTLFDDALACVRELSAPTP